MRFRGDPASIRGSIAPVVSPFTADGAADHESSAGQATARGLPKKGAPVLEGPVAGVADQTVAVAEGGR